jgi:hypothetical protein
MVPGPTPPAFAATIRRRAPAAKVLGAPHDVTNAPSVSPGAGQQGALLTSIDALPVPHDVTNAPSSATVCTTPSSTVPPAGHHMLTRFKTGHLQPNRKYAYNADVQQLPVAPSSMRMTLRDPAWHAAMQEEFKASQANNMGSHVPRPPPPSVNVITGKWLFKNKLLPNGSLDRRKARWVVRGFKQCLSMDIDQTFSPVVKLASIRTVLHLAASRH